MSGDDHTVTDGQAQGLLLDRRPGFTIIDNLVIEQYVPILGPTPFALYAYLAMRADRVGVSFPKQETVAAHLGTTRETVIRALKRLVDVGLVSTKRTGRGLVYEILPVRSRCDKIATSELDTDRLRYRENVTSDVTSMSHQEGGLNIEQETRTRELLRNSDRDVKRSRKKTTSDSPTGTRLSEDWEPSDADIEYAVLHGFGASDIRRIAEEFANYWQSVPGAKGRKLDWHKTWRNKILSEEKRSGPRLRVVEARDNAVVGKNLSEAEWLPWQNKRSPSAS